MKELTKIVKKLAENQEEIESKTDIKLPNPPEFLMKDLEEDNE